MAIQAQEELQTVEWVRGQGGKGEKSKVKQQQQTPQELDCQQAAAVLAVGFQVLLLLLFRAQKTGPVK